MFVVELEQLGDVEVAIVVGDQAEDDREVRVLIFGARMNSVIESRDRRGGHCPKDSEGTFSRRVRFACVPGPALFRSASMVETGAALVSGSPPRRSGPQSTERPGGGL
ncbi:hypothetical protein ACFORH_25695 [Amycolatopsis roodepoortensis]|uniref:Uncharacterized protein n=1 Tax=Amycolatopsis roodepoortensis TaxID=700274 RepID=A0ABR9LJX3_9PSEU|nr:hypothetical protein [Amycolatopsis roodepoortensis]MBE1580964.1 hypothetical protein [Amycolatopsis roodepoortensis]